MILIKDILKGIALTAVITGWAALGIYSTICSTPLGLAYLVVSVGTMIGLSRHASRE